MPRVRRPRAQAVERAVSVERHRRRFLDHRLTRDAHEPVPLRHLDGLDGLRWRERGEGRVGIPLALGTGGGEKDERECREVMAKVSYSTTTTGAPSTSIFGVMPRPGAVLADMKPFTRCGAPSAVETVT